ncbi:hypothetical protein PspLS_10149 [Pyricularia sp. CBS 133598]|nr:hypothetical protein PspLS_10149 [Pyricularia sp. CBS 133598]
MKPYSILSLATVVVPGALSLSPDIRADTNRDGKVDVQGSSDSTNKISWSAKHGAIFLPNVGDKSRRCARTDAAGNPWSNDELAACHDAAGHLLLAPEYAAPLRTLPLNVSAAGSARVYATPREAYRRVRIFVLEDPARPDATASWRLVDQELEFNATSLRKGLVLGLDGRGLVTDAAVWDGKVTVVFNVTDGGKTVSDSVTLKQAPVITHHHLQKVDMVVSTGTNNTDPIQTGFLRELDEGRKAAGIQAPMLLLNQSDDQWTQDFLEPAFVSMPGPNGRPVSLRVMLRSAQSTRTGGRQIFEQMRGPGFGGWQPASDTGSGFGHREINSYGNLETIPPYTARDGKTQYAAGRIIMGKHFGRLPAEALLTFLNSQSLQAPLILETGWLLIGHVDEFVQFLPYNNKLGFTISIADTLSGMKMLKEVQAGGHGKVRAVSFDKPGANEPGLRMTVDEVLANATFAEVNAYAQRHIDANLKLLLAEIPLDAEDVIRVPTLFRDGGNQFGGFLSDDGLPPHTSPLLAGERQLMAFYPASINGVVLGSHYVSPKPWGPRVDGTDVLAKRVEEAYARANMTVGYVDDYLSHHVRAGEVHCGSNTLRQTDVKWWE